MSVKVGEQVNVQGPGWGRWHQIRMILRSKSTDVFVGEKEDFVSDTGLELKPVKVDEGWADVFPGCLWQCEL